MRFFIQTTILLSLSTLGFSAETIEVDLTNVTLPKKVTDAEARLTAEITAARTAYEKAVAESKERAITSMERERGRTKDGLAALAIAAKVEQVRGITAVDPGPGLDDFMAVPFHGTYGDWVISENEEGQLSLVNSRHRSIDYLQVGNLHVFHWSNGNDAVVVEQVDDGVKMSCYSRFFNRNRLNSKVSFEGVNAHWTKTMVRDQ